jgi:uncharacterized protein (TIRG00374 family)
MMSNDIMPPHTPARKHLWTFAKIVLAVALTAIVLLQTSLQDIMATLQHASFGWLLVAVFAFLLSVGMMAWRAWYLLGKRVPFRAVLGSTIVQTSVGNLVATGAGMVAYVSLLRQQKHAPISYSVASLLLARVADVFVLSVTLGGVAFCWAGSEPVRWLATILCSAGVIICAVAMVVLWRHEWIIKQVRWASDRLGLMRFPVLVRAIDTLERLADDHSTTSISSVLFCTVANQSLSWLFFWACLQAFNLQLNQWASVLILALTQLIAVVPVQVLGGLGVFDATTIYFLGLFSIHATVAVPVLVGLRIVFYLCNLLLLLFPLIEPRLSLGVVRTREIL